jgi:hypothetical protein
MDFVVQFVGIILFIKLTGGGYTSYHLVMPNEAAICDFSTGDLGIHDTFIRIPKDTYVSQTGWSGGDIIPTTDGGMMFRVSDARITFDNLANKGPVSGVLTSPHLRDYHPSGNKAVLKSGLYSKTLTDAEMDISTGVVANDELPNGMIDTLWLLQTISGKDIVINATTRGTADKKTLTVKMGSRIQILNTPVDDAKGDFGSAMANDHHFVIYYNLTLPKPDAGDCKEPQPGGGGSLQRVSLANEVQGPAMQNKSYSPMLNKNATPAKMSMSITPSAEGEGGASIACSNSQWP